MNKKKPPPRDQDNPPAGPLLTGERIGRGPTYRAYRPRGRADWLAIYTVTGAGRVTHQGDDTPLARGDILVIHPGAPQDYGTAGPQYYWHNIWVHFVPRDEMVSWLDWPTIAPGVMKLSLPEELQPRVLREFRAMDRFAQQAIGHPQALGLNALERGLLLADEANPRSAAARYDPRIRRAIDWMMQHLANPPSLEAMAETAGLSRSRFALLFRQQVGQSPGSFLEQHRLFRVKRLLEHPHLTIQEIADEMGYSSPFYLSLRFRAMFDLSPRAYRRSMVQGP